MKQRIENFLSPRFVMAARWPLTIVSRCNTRSMLFRSRSPPARLSAERRVG